MHGYDIHEAFFQNCNINSPCVEGSGPRAGPIYQYSSSENVFNLIAIHSKGKFTKCMNLKFT